MKQFKVDNILTYTETKNSWNISLNLFEYIKYKKMKKETSLEELISYIPPPEGMIEWVNQRNEKIFKALENLYIPIKLTDQRDLDEIEFRKQEKNLTPMRDELYSVNSKFNGVYTEMVGTPELMETGKFFRRINGKRVYVERSEQIK